ncbi:nicotinamide riboside transporter PnuC [Undibacterium sp. RuRC25W]|uniref:nicotinamide riboside transporter PnuC n=1 Tax=Undibacterium sp. RuRC25W TaxID=3413047 RepID=UPI003BF1802F
MSDAIVFLGVTTNLLELISFLLAVITVALTIRQIHWGWLFSIVSSGLYAAVFFDAKLYGDMGLQGMFILVSIWGWWQWWRGNSEDERLQVTSLSLRQKIFFMVLWGALFAALVVFLKRYTDTDVPYADGFLTAGSLVGQFLLSRKKLENWTIWIIVDVLYVGLYLYKNLQLTALLYAVFVVMAVMGLRSWSKACQQ